VVQQKNDGENLTIQCFEKRRMPIPNSSFETDDLFLKEPNWMNHACENGFVTNGALDLRLRISVHVPAVHIETTPEMTSHAPVSVSTKHQPPPGSKKDFLLKTRNQLYEFQKQGAFCDVSFLCDDVVELKAHKVVLYIQSNVFKTECTELDQIQLNCTSEIGDELLKFLYTGSCELIDKEVELMKLAGHFQLEALFNLCEERLISSLSSDTVARALCTADAFKAIRLQQACREWFSLKIDRPLAEEGEKPPEESTTIAKDNPKKRRRVSIFDIFGNLSLQKPEGTRSITGQEGHQNL
jgi:hypothetical protein